MLDSINGQQAVRVCGELAGLVLPEVPVLWCADAVVVTLRLKLPSGARTASAFRVHVPGQEPLMAEGLTADRQSAGTFHVTFRLPTPSSSTVVDIVWNQKLLISTRINVVLKQEYLDSFQLKQAVLLPQYETGFAEATAFPATGVRGMLAQAKLSSPHTLAALLHLGMTVRVQDAYKVTLSANQLMSTSSMVTALVPRVPRRAGNAHLTWNVDSRAVLTVPFQILTARKFHQSLRLSSARHLWVNRDGLRRVTVAVPPPSVVLTGAMFVVRADLPGAVGPTAWTIRLGETTIAEGQCLVGDGPVTIEAPIGDVTSVPDTVPWTLYCGKTPVGTLPRGALGGPVFSAEGSYQEVVNFAWNPAADAELMARLEGLTKKETE